MILTVLIALVALSACGGDGGTESTSIQTARKALPEQAWEGMPCNGSAEITYGGCGEVP